MSQIEGVESELINLKNRNWTVTRVLLQKRLKETVIAKRFTIRVKRSTWQKLNEIFSQMIIERWVYVFTYLEKLSTESANKNMTILKRVHGNQMWAKSIQVPFKILLEGT